MVLLRERKSRLVGFIEPCLPSPAKVPPSGPNWIHEIKHDGFRIIARRDAAGVRLITRNGNDFTKRFPLAVAAVAALPGRSCLIDGEAIACDDNGLTDFELIRRHRNALSCAPSICSRSTARICGGCRSSSASIGLPGCCEDRTTASP
jgi:ATP-dependent DNA ligase